MEYTTVHESYVIKERGPHDKVYTMADIRKIEDRIEQIETQMMLDMYATNEESKPQETLTLEMLVDLMKSYEDEFRKTTPNPMDHAIAYHDGEFYYYKKSKPFWMERIDMGIDS